MPLPHFIAWFGMMLLAILNGAVRDFSYRALVGDFLAQQLSTVTLLLLFGDYFVWLFRRWPLVSAVRGAVTADVPSVDRRPGGLTAPVPHNPPAPAASVPAPAGWAQPVSERPAPLPVPAALPEPAPIPSPVMAPAQVATPREPSPALASRSPLTGLAGLRGSAGQAQRDEPAAPQAPLPADLPSVFARLAGEPQPRPAAAWQPRKGQP